MKKTEEISFKYRRRNFRINVKDCNYLEKILGLMFKARENTGALLFDFKKPVNMKIHSMFVFFPFIAVWLDEKNKVIEIKRIKPFTYGTKPKKSFNKLIEIPINKKYRSQVKLLVGD